MKPVYLLFVAAIFSIGCEPVECGARMENGDSIDGDMCQKYISRTLTISNEFSPNHIENIQNAGLLWNHAAPGKVNINFVVSGDKNPDIYLKKYPGSILSFEIDGKIEINADISELSEFSDYDMTISVAHELGHSFGLGHSRDKSALMYPLLRPDLAISEDDLNHFNTVARKGIY